MNTNMQLNNMFTNYFMDMFQRSILFLDVMRRRGNEMLEMTNNNASTVLNFDFEIIMDGSNFARPINYWLAKIISPHEYTTDLKKRPYVVQDPRAGQGPGIGGFKTNSEIGDAIKNGHPVYFIGFNSNPVEEQTYEDIIVGQVKFYEKVNELHPDSPKMCAIGNCAAGYLTMFSAMQKPDIFGPILIAGSPLSYWNGNRGQDTMRYKGGLTGGLWINSFLGDLGYGKFNGNYLILNFDLLNLSNFLWNKQYNLYANIDKEAQRYLQFEKWWGDFIQFNTEEIKWLVEKLFIGNLLTTGQLMTSEGIRLDPRNITSPIITFISDGDNISPPPQSAGWIADLYADVNEIKARGKTIVYCLNHKVGHLAIFTSTKVGQREDEMFVENMDTLEILPPGLYELVIENLETDDLTKTPIRSYYVPRTIEDIKNLGFNSEDDDRVFATVKKASEALDFLYMTFVHPIMAKLIDKETARNVKKFSPLYLSYTMFADRNNPFMAFVEYLENKITKQRIQVEENNIFWQIQSKYSEFVTNYIDKWQNIRDNINEQLFFNTWGNQFIQQFWGTDVVKPRYTPSITKLEYEDLLAKSEAEISRHFKLNNKVEALYRIVALVQHDKKFMYEEMAKAITEFAYKLDNNLDKVKLKKLIKYQFMVVNYNYDRSLLELGKFFNINDKSKEDILDMLNSKITDFNHQVTDEVKNILYQITNKLIDNKK